MQEESNDILHRLEHPEEEARRRKMPRNLLLGNVLNGLFMLMAAVAMAGLALSWNADRQPLWCYVLGLLAVVVKMAEALLRMPDLLRKPRQRGRRY